MKPKEALAAALRADAKAPPVDSGSWLTPAAPLQPHRLATKRSCRGELERLIRLGKPFALTGPPGSTKTTAVRAVAEALELRVVTLDAAAAQPQDVAAEVCGSVAVDAAVVVENAEVGGVALRNAIGDGRIIVILTETESSAARATLSRLPRCVFEPVPANNVAIALRLINQERGSPLSMESILDIAATSEGDLRAALIRAQWCALPGKGDIIADREPRNVSEATAELLGRERYNGLPSSVERRTDLMLTDRYLQTAYVAHYGMQGSRDLREASRLSEALSDDDAMGFAAEGAACVGLAVPREARHGTMHAYRFPGAASFGTMPRIATARIAAERRLGRDTLECFVVPVSRGTSSVGTKRPPGKLPADEVQAVRAMCGSAVTAKRCRAVAEAVFNDT